MFRCFLNFITKISINFFVFPLMYRMRRYAKSYISDRVFAIVYYFHFLQKLPNLDVPIRYTEKLQWYKLNGKLEQFSSFVDKYEVRKYVSTIIGESYLVPLIDVYDSVEDIKFDSLPKEFVIKLTHGSGYNYICHDKSLIDIRHLKSKLLSWQNENFYDIGREPQYKKCSRRFIVEKYLHEEGGLKDYKIFCFDGEPKFIHVDIDRSTNHTRAFFDLNWTRLPFTTLYPQAVKVIDRPSNLECLISTARSLSKGFKHVRVDLYNPGGKIYFGELTFTHGNGFEPFIPDEWDIVVGNYFVLPVIS